APLVGDGARRRRLRPRGSRRTAGQRPRPRRVAGTTRLAGSRTALAGTLEGRLAVAREPLRALRLLLGDAVARGLPLGLLGGQRLVDRDEVVLPGPRDEAIERP